MDYPGLIYILLLMKTGLRKSQKLKYHTTKEKSRSKNKTNPFTKNNTIQTSRFVKLGKHKYLNKAENLSILFTYIIISCSSCLKQNKNPPITAGVMYK